MGKPSTLFDVRKWRLPDSLASRPAPSQLTEVTKAAAPGRDELKQARAEIRKIFESGSAVGVKLKDTALRDKLKLQQDRITWLKKLTDDAEQAQTTLR